MKLSVRDALRLFWLSAAEPDVEEEEYEEEVVEALVGGSPSGSGGPEELSGLLMDLVVATRKLELLLAEADHQDFMAVRPRLIAFLTGVSKLNVEPPEPKRLGFRGGEES